MNLRSSAIALALASVASLGVVVSAGQAANVETPVARDVREALQRLPALGPFDFLSIRISGNGEVEVGGYAFDPTLRRQVEQTLRKVGGVSRIVTGIESLRAGDRRDELRAAVYLAFFQD